MEHKEQSLATRAGTPIHTFLLPPASPLPPFLPFSKQFVGTLSALPSEWKAGSLGVVWGCVSGWVDGSRSYPKKRKQVPSPRREEKNGDGIPLFRRKNLVGGNVKMDRCSRIPERVSHLPCCPGPISTQCFPPQRPGCHRIIRPSRPGSPAQAMGRLEPKRRVGPLLGKRPLRGRSPPPRSLQASCFSSTGTRTRDSDSGLEDL